MATTTFVTPQIPFADFADFNPGHGTDTVQQNVEYFRDVYGATRVKRITTPCGIQFAVTGPVESIGQLAKLYA